MVKGAGEATAAGADAVRLSVHRECCLENGSPALLDALRTLVQQHEIYRVKGFVALPGAAMRLVVQGVGTRFDSYFDRAWRADEVRATQLVLIGAELDGAALQAELDAALR